ncbi:MAG: cupredoxin domain-containing protein [Chloroflexi bacterium]|nr:cupredoxin domain-containing protein [Chloroflexota bacterium]MBI3740214.1 cupredoxin domain-containing protein [Chloroflexota bacterium]
MSKRTTIFFVVVALVAILIAGCGGSGGTGASSAGLNITVTNTEFKFDPAEITAAPGQTVNLTVKNAGSIQHTWILAAANVKLTVDPGQTVTKTFTAPAAGTYEITCDVPGHKEAGMVGKLTVK